MSALTATVPANVKWQARCVECNWSGSVYASIDKADAQGQLHDVLFHPNPEGSQ